MSDLDLELLHAWSPEPVAPSPEVRAHARAQLERAFDGAPAARPEARVRTQFVKRLAVAAVALVVLLVGASVWMQREVDDRVDSIRTVTVPNRSLGGGEVGHGPVNILLVGSDERDGNNPEAFGTPAETGPPRSDTMILLRIDGTSVRGLWIPRDLVLTTGPDAGALINSTFNHGPARLIAAIKNELDVDIDHYVEVDFTGFPKVVDAAGGVKLFFPGPTRDQYSGLDVATGGCRTLDGRAALAFVRSRSTEIKENGIWTNVSPRADLTRAGLQQQLIGALVRQMKEHAAGDPAAAVDLVDALIPPLVFDSGFTRSEIFGLVRSLIDVDPDALVLGTVPVQETGDGNLLLPQPAAGQALAPFRGAAPSSAPTPPATPPAPTPFHPC